LELSHFFGSCEGSGGRPYRLLKADSELQTGARGQVAVPDPAPVLRQHFIRDGCF
jgi:hypothetical protein